MQFSDVLASAIHDIKNSLGMVINTVEELASDPQHGLAGNPRAVALQLEARRANNDLVQLLTLYKFEAEKVTLNIAEHNVEDFLDDIMVEHTGLAEARGISIELDCDPYLTGYFDEDLVRGVINNAIGNAERYSKNRIRLSAVEKDGFLVLQVQDNGDGFPQEMLRMQDALESGQVFSRGRTRLGLFFSRQVAKAHRNAGREGEIRLDNDCGLVGGCFSIRLP